MAIRRRRHAIRRRRPFRRIRRFRRRVSLRRPRFRRRRGNTLFRNRRRMRRFNTGRLNFNRILASGDTLPQTAFGRVTYSTGSIRYIFAAEGETTNTYTAGSYGASAMRTICLNDMGRVLSPLAANFVPALAQPHFRYFGLYNIFYKRYQVLGSRLVIRLSPGLFLPVSNPPFTGTNNKGHVYQNNPADTANPPRFLSDPTSGFVSPGPMENSLYSPNSNGYWYIRVATNGNALDSTLSVGHPVDVGEEDAVPWQRVSDFLGDRTVTYTRDMRNFEVGYNQIPSGTGWVVGSSIKTVVGSRKVSAVLTYNFSAKKLFKDVNLLSPTSRQWLAVNHDVLNFPYQRAFVRFGYVQFSTETGFPMFHYPMPLPFIAQIEMKYYNAWRDPVDLSTLSGSGAGALRTMIDQMSDDQKQARISRLNPDVAEALVTQVEETTGADSDFYMSDLDSEFEEDEEEPIVPFEPLPVVHKGE